MEFYTLFVISVLIDQTGMVKTETEVYNVGREVCMQQANKHTFDAMFRDESGHLAGGYSAARCEKVKTDV